MNHFKIVKSKAQIQNKWDSMICRSFKTGMRLKEAYYEIARFSTGKRFDGSREQLQRFVIDLEIKRLTEITKYKGCMGGRARSDFKLAIKAHCPELYEDLFSIGPILVLLDIEKYKWRSLAHKRVMMQERRTQDAQHTYSSKSGCGVGQCSDWKTVK